jgi:hypothetical protein
MKNLDAKELGTLLVSLRARKPVIDWVKGKSLAEAWSTCHRGDWMLWLAARYGDVPKKTIVAIACDCAEPALAFTSDPRPAECIAVVRRWLKDEATISDARAAAYAARAAAYAAAGAAGAAADAAGAAAYAAAGAAGAESLQFSADICRKYISVEDNHDQNCH